MALTDVAVLSYNCGPKGKAGQGGKASTRGSTAKLTAGNIVAQDAALTAWAAAANNLSKGVITRQSIEHGSNNAVTLPDVPQNKGEKWVVTMTETGGNGRIFTHSIPSADESGTRVLPNTLNWNPADTNWEAYATAAQAFLTTPDGNALTLTSATLLTRRR